MTKRMISMLAITAVVLAALGFAKFNQIKTAIAASNYQPPPEAITTIAAKQEKWPSTISVVGTLAAIHGVTISADLPGTVDQIQFESGRAVNQGEVLVQLDTRQERAQLAAAEAARDLAHVNYARAKELVDQGVISRSVYDQATSEQKSADAKVGEIRATIERKTIRAPFTGILGIRQANLGQYLAAGDPIVPLQSVNPIYVNFGVPQDASTEIHVGQTIHIEAKENGAAGITGRVTAINSVVDEATRNIQIQATIPNLERKLRPGMFVQVEAGVGVDRAVIALPASAVSYAPFGDSVFIVSELTSPDGKTYRGVRQQFVKLGGTRGDQVAILAGIKPGEEVVTSGVFKLRTGAAVRVDNSIQPANSPSPKPEDN